ncbi:MAG: hypothetical protein JW891_07815, partial [Candidatus Lokiarchaeota archaeon]|nr:hypothetical protein [Candidatus Lokiarchaeota archaeon]
NGIEAVKMAEKYNPDILIIDLKEENLKFLRDFTIIHSKKSIPAVFFFSPDKNRKALHSEVTSYGFIDFSSIIKPKYFTRDLYENLKQKLTTNIVKSFKTKIDTIEKKKDKIRESITQNLSEQSIKPENIHYLEHFNPNDTINLKKHYDKNDFEIKITPVHIEKLETNIIVMGASVGGPKTLPSILKEIPANFPSPILIVQHLNHFFMRQFAISLRGICNLPVRIPSNGEEILAGKIYLSPGEHHMEIVVINNKPCIRTFEGERVNFCRPSVDVLFLSAAKVYKNNTMGILLTGMGKDGVKGLLAIKKMGGKTIAESEETSILYGMPKIAAENEAANIILPNYKIKDMMIQFARKL